MKSRVLFCLLSVVAIVQVVAFPSVYISAFYSGLSLFYSKLLPVLFPFFIFSGILLKTGILYDISSKFFAPIARKIGLSCHFPYVFILSVMSGYPMNAKLTKDLMESGEIGISEGESLAFSTSCSGILFVCTTVGIIMFKSVQVGVILMFCHVSACLSGYFLFSFLMRNKSSKHVEFNTMKTLDKRDFQVFAAISESVYSALFSILLVGTYVCIFSVVAKMFEVAGLFSIFPPLFEGFFCGILEITTGINFISTLTISPLSLAIACSLVCFGGISINLQCLSLLLSCGISASRYFILKTLQMICGFAISLAVFKVLYLFF